MATKNKILKFDPTTDGIKTGYTVPAGHCFVGSTVRNGSRFISVILASTKDWMADQKALMSWAFRNFKRSCLEEAGQVEHPVPILGGEREVLKAVVKESVFYAHPVGQPPAVLIEIKPNPGLAAPIAAGTEVGKAVFRDNAGWSFETPLYASEDLPKASPGKLAALASPGPAGVLIACVLGGGALWMRRKASRMI